jgi:hypothetical protein
MTLTIKVPIWSQAADSSPLVASALPEGWNPRNELKLPLKPDVNLDKVKLDFDSPRMIQAMRNLGMTKKDLTVHERLISMSAIQEIRYKAIKEAVVTCINKVLEERKRIRRGDSPARLMSTRDLISQQFASKRQGSAVFMEAQPKPVQPQMQQSPSAQSLTSYRSSSSKLKDTVLAHKEHV